MLDRLTLDQLRVLIAVAETGSFSAAARRLGRVQSAVSQAVQALETALGTELFDRAGKVPKLSDAGRVILDDARHLVRGVETLKARAESIRDDVEPDLGIAVDVTFPNDVLIASLRGLRDAFPCMPVTVFTEGLGAAEQRLRDGSARLAIFTPVPGQAQDLDMEFLVGVPLLPVAAASHPLASAPAPIGREELEQHVQLVLTDRSNLWQGVSGGVVSPRVWRFADQSTRHDFLLAGMGWCNMPAHTVRTDVAAGRLKRLELREGSSTVLPLHVVHRRGHAPGRAGRWLIEDLRVRVQSCVGANAFDERAA